MLSSSSSLRKKKKKNEAFFFPLSLPPILSILTLGALNISRLIRARTSRARVRTVTCTARAEEQQMKPSCKAAAAAGSASERLAAAAAACRSLIASPGASPLSMSPHRGEPDDCRRLSRGCGSRERRIPCWFNPQRRRQSGSRLL